MTVDRRCVDDDHTRKLWFADSGDEVEVTERQQEAAKTKRSHQTTQRRKWRKSQGQYARAFDWLGSAAEVSSVVAVGQK